MLLFNYKKNINYRLLQQNALNSYKMYHKCDFENKVKQNSNIDINCDSTLLKFFRNSVT